jgi:peptidyl-Lys metalloendopeptidase
MSIRKKISKQFITLFFIPILTLSLLKAENSLFIELNQDITNGSILVTLTNDTTEPVNVLKWNTPLEEKLSANIFRVEHNQKESIYSGRLIKRGQPKDEDYTLFESGESRTLTVYLPTYYQMLKEGNYTISYRGGFSSLNEKEQSKRLKKSENSKTTVELYFIPTQSLEPKKQKVTAKFTSCNQQEIEAINKAHDSSLLIAKTAFNALNSADQNTRAKRYVTWFGKATTQRQSTVTSHFSKIYDALENKKLSYNCSPCEEDGVFAYVFPKEEYNIYLCQSFWSADLLGTDSQSGTLIHELSHFLTIAGTLDHEYGQNDTKRLAKTSPDKAINNADNHEFFAENTPFINMNEEGTNRFNNSRTISKFPLVDTISSPELTNLYKLIPSKNVEYHLYTTGKLDTHGILYDENENILRKNDDTSSSNQNFTLYYNLIPNKIYYLEVGAYNKEVGEFTLHQESKEIDVPKDNNNNNNNNNNENENQQNQSSRDIPAFNTMGLLLLILLTFFIAHRELKKSL